MRDLSRAWQGIKVIGIGTSKLARLLGKVENTERFAALALFQGRATQGSAMIGSGAKITEVRAAAAASEPRGPHREPVAPTAEPCVVTHVAGGRPDTLLLRL